MWEVSFNVPFSSENGKGSEEKQCHTVLKREKNDFCIYLGYASAIIHHVAASPPHLAQKRHLPPLWFISESKITYKKEKKGYNKGVQNRKQSAVVADA